MARRFSRVAGAKIACSIGGCNFAFGPGTIAYVVRLIDDTTDDNPLSIGAATDIALYTDGSTHNLRLWNGSVDSGTSFTVRSTDGWVLLAATKATGTVAATLYKYVYSTKTWTVATSSGTLANSPVADTRIYIGSDDLGGSYHDGDWKIGAVWNVVLTQSQIESLALDLSPANWSGNVAPKGGWIPDKDNTVAVVDFTGNGANQTSITATTATPDEIAVALPAAPTQTDRRQWRSLRLTRPHRFGRPEVAKAVVGSTTSGANTVSLAGAVTPAGSLADAVAKSASGAITPAGTLADRAAKTLTGAVTPAATLANRVGKALAGAVTPAGALSNRAGKALAGALTPAGALANRARKALAGSITPAGTLRDTDAELLAGSITPAGTIAKVARKALAGALTPAGTVRDTVGKLLAGVVTPAGALQNRTSKAAGGTITPTGTLTTFSGVVLATAGNITPAGAVTLNVTTALVQGATGGVARNLALEQELARLIRQRQLEEEEELLLLAFALDD